MKGKLGLFIAPEINRINYFVKLSGISLHKTLLLPNSTSELSSAINSGYSRQSTVTIAHIGVANEGHYTREFLLALSSLDELKNYKVQFIGHLPDKVKELIREHNLPSVE